MQTLFEEYPMLLLGLEAGIALFLLLFMVWWTISGARNGPQRPLRAPAPDTPPTGDGAGTNADDAATQATAPPVPTKPANSNEASGRR